MIREALKKWYFLGIILNQGPLPLLLHLGIKMSLLAEKVGFSRPKTMSTKNFYLQFRNTRAPPPYLENIPKKYQFALVLPYGMDALPLAK